jgi:hypothetical protein
MLGRYRDQLLKGFTPQSGGDPDTPDNDAFDDLLEHAVRENLRRGDQHTATDEGLQRTFRLRRLSDP